MVGLDADHNRDDDCENIGLGCALEHFSEVEEVLGMIDNVKNIVKTQEYEAQYEKFYNILKQYYEQPHLLDPHLDKILSKFLTVIKDKESSTDLKHAVFDYMYQVIRVRSYKVVVRHLPHEVTDLLMVLTFLEEQDPNDKETWRSRFVLLLWLSIVVIIPFHMSRLDGFAPGQQEDASTKKLTVMERIFNICKTYAMSKDTCAEASAYLASKFLIRSDVKELYMSSFFNWACELQSNIQLESTLHYGVLAAVAAVLKHGKRDDLLPFAPKLLQWVTEQNFKQHSAMLVRKYGVKIVQRIGLTFLRPRVATWRYTRGSRCLAVTLGGAEAAGEPSPAAAPPDTDTDNDIPQEVEDVVELLLCSLRDDDTVVRWSAAKGVGRIGARLPAAAAADVAECALALFAENERETAWHGGCMALAELARRELLSPAQLGSAVSAVVRALRRDEPRATGGGGGRAARDAACHAAWAFARAYDAPALAPHANVIANALIATACFDREINCRRAASAAYQENVGRHGMFPNGIDVLTTADFQSVGPRNNAYLLIAPQVASYPDYTKPLIDHIVELKIEHWDFAIRELAAKALHKLTCKIPDYVATTVLPQLLKKTESIDLNVRHGAILGIGEAVYALSLAELSDGTKADILISDALWTGVRELVPRLRTRQQLRGLGGELMRQACCQCIAALSLAKAPYHGHSTIDEWLNLIEECLSHEVQPIREKAIHALPLVFTEYLQSDGLSYGEQSVKEKRLQLLGKYCEQLTATGASGLLLRMGYARAVGSLPKFALDGNLRLVIRSLIECSRVTEATQKWAEARRDAVVGLTEVCQTEGVAGGVEEYVGEVVEALLACLSEYTVDLRGDIGAWVREASMSGLLAICRQCAVEAPHLNSPEIIKDIMAVIAQQSVEKIDRTRAHAGRIFTSFIYNDPPITNIPHHDALKRIFPPDEIKEDSATEQTAASESSGVVLWLFPGHTMPRFVQLLRLQTYRYSVVKGLVVSAGELTESLVKHTTQSLYSYLNTLQDDKEMMKAICDTIIQVFADHLHQKRITGPMFNFLDRLLSSGSISPILEDPESTFAKDILKYLQLELRGAKNVYKLLDSINVLCQLIQVGGVVCSKALGQLVIYICYADRYVRRCAAARLYEAITLYGDCSLPAEHLDQVGGVVCSKALGQLVIYICYADRYVRRCAAARLYEAITLYGDCSLPAEHLDQVMTVLAETDWEKDVEELRPIRNELCDLMGIKRPVMKQKTAS